MPTIITESSYIRDHILNINLPFKVEAGAGAGKTHWLIQHVKRILKESKRLNVGKVACISYTTVASEEIAKRLNYNEQVSCSTIHSFLYKNVVKPYFHFIEDDFSHIPQEKIKGHREHIPYLEKVLELILLPMDFEGKERLISDGEISSGFFKFRLANSVFASFGWEFDAESEDLVLSLNNSSVQRGRNPIGFPTTSELYQTYKNYYWSEGIIHHEDVLFFAFKIFQKKPSLYKFLAAKFPYIYIDEFQDTISIQTVIVRNLSRAGATVGVIGDKAQAIYSFSGAKLSEFLNFTLEGIVHLEIRDNWRSSQSIIYFTNTISQFNQEKRNEDDFDSPVVLCVGDNHIDNWHKYLRNRGLDATDFSPQYLVRSNDDAAQIRNALFDNTNNSLTGFWREFSENYNDCQEFFGFLAKALAMIHLKKLPDAINAVASIFTTQGENYQAPLLLDKLDISNEKVLAVRLIQYLKKLPNGVSLVEMYGGINLLLEEGISQDLPNGALENLTVEETNFLQPISIIDLSNNAKLVLEPFENDPVHTIHKVKGEEFNSVVICMNPSYRERRVDELFMSHLVNGDISDDGQEETRVYYVAASRAKKHLVFSMEALSSENEELIRENFTDILILR